MEVKLKYQEKKYPYLAVWGGPDYDPDVTKNVDPEDILVISLVDKQDEGAKIPYAQHLMGGEQGYFLRHEEEYAPLPAGFVAKIKQTP